MRTPQLYWKRGRAYVRFWDQTGEHFQTLDTDRPREAQTRLAEFKDHFRNRQISHGKTLLLPDLFQLREDHLSAMNHAPGGILREKYVIKAFARYYSKKTLPQIQDFEGYFAYRAQQGISPVTRNIERRNLQAIFNWGSKRGYCPPLKLEKIKVPEALPLYFESDEVQKILRAERDPIWRLFWELCLYTGGRRNEVLYLIGEDFKNGSVIFRQTKTGRPRIVPLPPKFAARIHVKPSRIFNFVPHTVSDRFHALCQSVGIQPEKTHLHVMRHTYATRLRQKGVGLEVIQKLLGHSSIAVTMIYAHVIQVDLERAVSLMEIEEIDEDKIG